MLASLYNGNVHVWNHESQTLVKSFEITDLPGKKSGIQKVYSYQLISESSVPPTCPNDEGKKGCL